MSTHIRPPPVHQIIVLTGQGVDQKCLGWEVSAGGWQMSTQLGRSLGWICHWVCGYPSPIWGHSPKWEQCRKAILEPKRTSFIPFLVQAHLFITYRLEGLGWHLLPPFPSFTFSLEVLNIQLYLCRLRTCDWRVFMILQRTYTGITFACIGFLEYSMGAGSGNKGHSSNLVPFLAQAYTPCVYCSRVLWSCSIKTCTWSTPSDRVMKKSLPNFMAKFHCLAYPCPQIQL